MKKLFLLRHAKSGWDNPSQRDIERTLDEQGLKAAPAVGNFLREKGIHPRLVLCSPARRTVETLELITEAAGFAPEVRFDERIYAASLGRLLEVIAGVEDDYGEVMIVGHNPGLAETLQYLTGESHRFPAAALALVRLEIERWSEVSESCGRLDRLITPQSLTVK